MARDFRRQNRRTCEFVIIEILFVAVPRKLRASCEVDDMADTDRRATSAEASELLNITSPANWAALSGLLLLVVIALIWAVKGNLPVEVSGRAVLIPEGGLTRAETPTAGVVTSFQVKEGDRVSKGQTLATLTSGDKDQSSVQIVSPFDGVVVQRLTDEGNYVVAGTAIFLVGGGNSDRLSAWVFVPFENVVAVEPGMPAFLSPQSIASEENGYLEGTVTGVDQFPVTKDRLADTFGDDPRWIEYLLGDDGPRGLVRVALKPSSSPSGYQWTMGDGPSQGLVNGMVCQGSIQVSFSHPIDSAMPKHDAKKSKS